MSASVSIQIGNSDDKLTQSEWADFCADVEAAIEDQFPHVYGAWFSRPDSQYQNACWMFKALSADDELKLRDRLHDICANYEQDSIAWTSGTTELLTPSGGTNE